MCGEFNVTCRNNSNVKILLKKNKTAKMMRGKNSGHKNFGDEYSGAEKIPRRNYIEPSERYLPFY